MSWLQDSSTYQAILAEGRAEGEARGRIAEARRLLIALGSEKLGAPSQPITTALDRIDDLQHLERLHHRLLTATTWSELLAAEPNC